MKFQTIVVATDFSESSLVAVETAFNLALDGSHDLYLLHVLEPPVINDPMGVYHPAITQMVESAQDQLKSLVPDSLKEEVEVKPVVLTESGAAKSIADFAEEKDADLIIVGTHGRTGLSRMLLGSTAESLLRRAPCKVLVVKHQVKAA